MLGRSIIMAFSLFSIIPTPKVEWDERNMRYVLAAFPLVGVAEAVLLGVWLWLCAVLGFDRIIGALGVVLIPLVFTGGIHLDGFADTVDALSSHAEPARKREILKDPHIGAFAAIGVAAYLLAFFAIATQLPYGLWGLGFGNTVWAVLLIPVISRTMSGIVSLVVPGVGEAAEGGEKPGLLAAFRTSADTRGVLVVLAVILVIALDLAGMFVGWRYLIAVIVVVALLTLWLVSMFKRKFGGISGDLSGFYLQVIELALLVVAAVFAGVMFL